MVRTVASILGLIFLLGVLAWGTLYVSLSSSDHRPDQVQVKGLKHSVSIAWGKQEVPYLQAGSVEDRLTALGYVHGVERTWSVVFWRQTALGELSQWLGGKVKTLDQLARQMGWAERARQRYQRLPEQQKERLQAYARGVNAALALRTNQVAELLVFDIQPKPWEPWHSLAVEQLIAWLGRSELQVPDALANDSKAGRWLAADRKLRRWLHLHSFDQSAAWARRDSSGTSFVWRGVYGSSARSLFEEVVFETKGKKTTIASVPGTLMFPAGQNGSYAWMMFLTSSARLVPVAEKEKVPQPQYKTVVVKDSSNTLVAVQRSSKGLYLSNQWRLQWEGFKQSTDLTAWLALSAGASEKAEFQLIKGNGCLIRKNGQLQVLNQPAVVKQWPDGLLVGEHAWSRRVAERLQSIDTGTAPDRFPSDVYSPWADTLHQWMIGALNSSRTWDRQSQDAMTYLRNWDGTFSSASIGASIFDRWVASYKNATGVLPSHRLRLHSGERMLLYSTFAQAVDSLANRYGPDISRWRWGMVQPARQYFPLWSHAELLDKNVDDLAQGRYKPVKSSGGGHPSTLRWGASLLDEDQPPSAVWEAVVLTSQWHRMNIREVVVPVDGFLKRYMALDNYPLEFTINALERPDARLVTLRPAGEE